MANLEKCVFIDFETKSERSIEDGSFAYAADPSTDFLLVSYIVEDGEPICVDNPFSPQIGLLHKCIRNGYKIIAHNCLFEIAIFKYVMVPKYHWPMPHVSQWLDTMHMAGRAGLPLSLSACASTLNITEKLDEGKNLIKLFSCPPFTLMNDRPREKERFMEYCKQDTRVSRAIWENLPDFKPNELLDIQLDLESNLHGVTIDTALAQRIYNNVLDIQATFAERAEEITGGIITKMTQVQRLKKWVHECVSQDIPNCAADSIQEMLDGVYGELDEVTEELLLMRQHSGKSSTGKYYRYINSSIDDKIYGMIISFGAHTGRTISKLLNLNNLPKPSVNYKSMDELIKDLQVCNVDCINDKYSSYLKTASTAIRGIIRAPNNHVLAVADYASIEARLVFWLAHSMDGLRKYHDGIDLYKDMASTIYSTPYSQVTDKQRWTGKQVILGAGFGLGWKGFIGSCERFGVEVPEDLAQQSIESYRSDYPEVVALWDDLDRKSMQSCITGQITYAAKGRIAFKTMKTKSGITFLLMKLPSGRFMSYPDVKIIKATTPWGSKRRAVSYKKQINGKWLRETTYGGKLTENAIQAIARDLMYYGAQQAKSSGYDVLFSVYDEIIAEIPKDKADISQFESLICELPEWGAGIPLEAEGKILTNYQKL